MGLERPFHNRTLALALKAMLVTKEDLTRLVERSSKPNVEFWSYVAHNPQVLMATGFDEIRVKPSDLAQEMRSTRRHIADLVLSGSEELPPNHFIKMRQIVFLEREEEELDFFDLLLGLNCRQVSSGAWFHADPEVRFEYWLPNQEAGRPRTDEKEILASLGRRQISLSSFPLSSGKTEIGLTPEGICAACERYFESHGYTATLVLPGMWIPPEKHPTIAVVEAAQDLLRAIKKERKSLQDLRWQDLEVIVAELLRDMGMEVRVTPRSRDGGRDVIAKGELIPGEPGVLAVEVKHKKVVNLEDLRGRIYANKDFPALLFATSGRFTAGVVREKQKPGNYLRLFLKDGVGLSQWIESYGGLT